MLLFLDFSYFHLVILIHFIIFLLILYYSLLILYVILLNFIILYYSLLNLFCIPIYFLYSLKATPLQSILDQSLPYFNYSE